MIIYHEMSGYGNSSYNILCVTVWKDIFQTAAPMYFMPGEYTNILDVSVDKEDLRIATYPFTDKNRTSILAEKHQKEIMELYKFVTANKYRLYVTIALTENGPIEITKEHFVRNYPDVNLGNELFILDIEEEHGGFPQIYCMTKSHQVGIHQNTLQIMAESSHCTFDSADKPTVFGKELMYILYQSKLLGRFSSQIPDLTDINFPTNGKAAVSTRLNVQKLEALFERAGVFSVAKETEENPTSTAIVPVDSTKSSSMSGLEETILKQALEKGNVNLSDIFTAGIPTVLSLLDSQGLYVEVFMDVAGIARKAGIFEGMLYVTPFEEDFDVEEAFGVSTEYVFVCPTVDSFPNIIEKGDL